VTRKKTPNVQKAREKALNAFLCDTSKKEQPLKYSLSNYLREKLKVNMITISFCRAWTIASIHVISFHIGFTKEEMVCTPVTIW
jgi:hypothetical protein